jgi:hypothetical protein
MAREWHKVQKGLDLYLPIVKAFGDPVFMLTSEVYYAIARAFEGDRAAFDKAVQLINFCFEIGFSAFAVSLCALIGELYYRFEEYEPGLAWVEKNLAHVYRTGTHINTAELHRVKGINLDALGKDARTVERCFQEALALSREQSAKTYELRAACDLARLWRKQGKTKEAHDLVQKTYNWFTEGYDSVDLRDARSLMEKLNSEM